MEFRISNFSLVHKALQILSKRLDCNFIDLPIKFDNVPAATFDGSHLIIKEGGSLLDTMAYIYSAYINAMDSICGRNIDTMDGRNTLINLFLSILRDFKTEYGENPLFDKTDLFLMKLDQFPVVWMLLKNIFCPYRQLPLKNIRVIAKCSSEIDAVVCVTEENRPKGIPSDSPSLFLNLDIEKASVRSAFLLVESLRLHVKDNETPEALIREVFSNFFMRDRLIDFLNMAFIEDSDTANFLAVLSILCQSKDIEDLAMSITKQNEVKTAQASAYSGNWWFLGLTEKMLDGVRGPDWSTTQNLKDFSKDLWDKVEDERRRRGLSELPFELLLRVQSEELKVNPNQTLQQLLSKTRIW